MYWRHFQSHGHPTEVAGVERSFRLIAAECLLHFQALADYVMARKLSLIPLLTAAMLHAIWPCRPRFLPDESTSSKRAIAWSTKTSSAPASRIGA